MENVEHQLNMDEVKILAVEPRWLRWGVREAIHVRVGWPSLNRDGAITIHPPLYLKQCTRGPARGPTTNLTHG